MKKSVKLSIAGVWFFLIIVAVSYVVFPEFHQYIEGIRALASSPPQTAKLRLPPGFHVDILARVPAARQMCLGPKGTLFVGTRIDHGPVYAVKDALGDGPKECHTIINGLFMPNGVDMRDGALYVAEVNRVLRFDDIESHIDTPPKPIVVNDTFPKNPHHGWKYIRFGPDGWLYVPIGGPFNVGVDKDPRFAGIMRMKPDGTGLERFADGIRNTVGFDWDPKTKELWFTDNGRDWLGDDLPPDELNHAPRAGMNFGFPHRYGHNIVDPEWGQKAPAGVEFTPAAQDLGPHVASLGMRFYTGSMFPPEYRNQIFIAEHGSWNRSQKIGYRITVVRLKKGKPVKYETFMDGFLQPDAGVWGRPVDIIQAPDGSLLVSDDQSGTIYRITYQKPK